MRFKSLKAFYFILIIFWLSSFSSMALGQYDNFTELLLAVNLNQQQSGDIALFLRDKSNMIWVSQSELKKWRVKSLYGKPIYYDGAEFYRLSDFKEIKYTLDSFKSSIDVVVEPAAFKNYQLSLRPDVYLVPQKSPFGGFLNYDFFAQKTTTSTTVTNANIEPGIFNNFGVITSGFLAKDIGGQDNKIVRLNSLWQIDSPEKMQTLAFGDTINTPGMWGRAVSFGGFHWGTNFATRPEFTTFPLPAVNGSAVVPTTADLYLNNALIKRSDLPPGPFDITSIPVVTGQGNIQLVTTDVLGRQQVVNVPYYTSTEILRSGLNDFSVESGFVRRDYGIKSNNYGDFLFSATDNYGVTDNFTSAIHAEMFATTPALGVGGNYLLGNYGVLSGSVAGSRDNHNSYGALFMVTFNHQAQIFSYGLSTTVTTSGFRQVGYDDKLPPAMENQAYVALSLQKRGSISLSFIGRNNRDQEDQRFLTAGYSLNLTKSMFFDVTALTSLGGVKNHGVLLNLLVSLSDNTTGNINYNRNNGHDQYSVQIQRNLPVGTGYGYRLNATGGERQYVSGGLSLQNSIGTYSAQLAVENKESPSYQIDATGGIAILNKDFFLSRRINQSFAVVNVPGYSNVPVDLENHEVAKTDGAGNAFIPNLIPYVANHISVDPDKLPMDAAIENDKISAVPYYRAGVLVKMPIKRSYSASLTAKLPNGKYVPVGAEVNVVGQDESSNVAYDGKIYLTDLQPHNHVNISWDGQKCGFDLTYLPPSSPVPDLGTVICASNNYE